MGGDENNKRTLQRLWWFYSFEVIDNQQRASALCRSDVEISNKVIVKLKVILLNCVTFTHSIVASLEGTCSLVKGVSLSAEKPWELNFY